MVQEYVELKQDHDVTMMALITLSLFKDDNQAENIRVNQDRNLSHNIKTNIIVLTTQLY